LEAKKCHLYGGMCTAKYAESIDSSIDRGRLGEEKIEGKNGIKGVKDDSAGKIEERKSILKDIEMPNHAVHSAYLLLGTPARVLGTSLDSMCLPVLRLPLSNSLH
jgi:hypothetical protein